MSIAYFKRFKMEMDLYDAPPLPVLPPGYFLVAWDPSLLEIHAEVKYYSFQDEIDTCVFPSLATREGCGLLMQEICHKKGFLPEATWLAGCPGGYCATIQGVTERTGMGAVQNLGVMTEHRGRGLGRALLIQALHGFRRAGLGQGILEVTAQNDAAVRLYRSVGFRSRKTVYKAVAAPELEPADRFQI